ncbi:hypothetical protein TWF694_004997 [Orbilia ellipsospora]|uniref:Phosphoribulokinase/uridine kinase domain-containing protein n=1 Tax=Orbilia ellipsospora TaxID=2528407 RepID=A0AAV9X0C9_9PEZI
MPTRSELLSTILNLLSTRDTTRCTFLAIDGPPGSGKTTLGNDLATLLASKNIPSVRLDTDGFTHPEHIRFDPDRYSPEGFLNRYNYDGFFDYAIRPLLYAEDGAGRTRYKKAIYQHEGDKELVLPWTAAEPGAVVIVDGVFLHRAGLDGLWDVSVYLDVGEDTWIQRFMNREGVDWPLDIVKSYLVGGLRIYQQEGKPEEKATLKVDHDDFRSPSLSFNGKVKQFKHDIDLDIILRELKAQTAIETGMARKTYQPGGVPS